MGKYFLSYVRFTFNAFFGPAPKNKMNYAQINTTFSFGFSRIGFL